MYTRQDYLNHKCTHSEYFAQFVNDMQKRIVLERWTAKELARSWENDEAFNTRSTPIAQWDRLACPIDHRLLDELGEYSTPSTRVCILKEAARQIVMDHYETYGGVTIGSGIRSFILKTTPKTVKGMGRTRKRRTARACNVRSREHTRSACFCQKPSTVNTTQSQTCGSA